MWEVPAVQLVVAVIYFIVLVMVDNERRFLILIVMVILINISIDNERRNYYSYAKQR